MNSVITVGPFTLTCRRSLAAARTIADPRSITCPDCFESIAWSGVAILGDRTKGWAHRRTGLEKCSPLCDACSKPAVHALGGRAFDGSWMPRNFLCGDCFAIVKADRPLWEVA